jgi:hypothetical protein
MPAHNSRGTSQPQRPTVIGSNVRVDSIRDSRSSGTVGLE